MTGPDTTDDGGPPALAPGVAELLADPMTWAEPGTDLEDRIVSAIAAESAPFVQLSDGTNRARPWRSAFLGGAAVLGLVLGAVVVLSALSETAEGESVAMELVPTGLVSDVSGTVEMTETETGLQIRLHAVGLPRRVDGTYYEGWLRTTAGDLIPVGTFYEGTTVVLWGGVGLADVEAFSVTREGLARIDESGAGSSGDVVVKAKLP